MGGAQLTVFALDDDPYDGHATLSESLARGTALRSNPGRQGFSEERDVTWHPDVGVWSLLGPGDELIEVLIDIGWDVPAGHPHVEPAGMPVTSSVSRTSAPPPVGIG